MSNVLAFILAGGRVDELQKLTKFRPKAAVPFGGLFRIIDFPLSNLMHSGIRYVGVLSQYRSSPLINHVLDGSSWDFYGRNRLLKLLPPFKGEKESDWYNGTVDAVHQNLDFVWSINPDWVLILSGDHIYKMNYADVIEYHVRKQADLTIGFVQIDPRESHRFGVAEIDDEDGEVGGRVRHYVEKPRDIQLPWASMTVYVFNTPFLHSCLEMAMPQLKLKGTVEFGRDVIVPLVESGSKYRVYGYKFRGYWGYTRTVQELWQSNMDLLYHPEKIDLEKWEIRTNLDHRGIKDRIPAIYRKSARVENSLICHGCEIRGEVVNSVLSPGVVVEEGAKVYNSVVMFDSRIGKETALNNVILDVDVTVAPGLRLGDTENLRPDPEKILVFGEAERVEDANSAEQDSGDSSGIRAKT